VGGGADETTELSGEQPVKDALREAEGVFKEQRA
jgi:hypothetical protein